MTTSLRRFALEDEPSGLGLNCEVSRGVTLAGAPLLSKTAAGFRPRPDHEVDLLLTAAYRQEIDTGAMVRALGTVADALNCGDAELAMIAALHLRLPPLDPDGAVRLARVHDLIAKYSPDQPRDWHGRWTAEGDTDGTSTSTTETGSLDTPTRSEGHSGDDLLTPVAYNGRYHDQLLAQYAEYLRSKGESVLTEVGFRMADGSVGARLDILARDPTTGIVYGVEIKTGDDPGFTPGQLTVYAHMMMGEAVMATDAKVASLGLPPGVPLPPIPIYLMWKLNAQTDPVYRPLDPLKMARRYRGEH